MNRKPASPPVARAAAGQRRPLKAIWRKVRKPLAESRLFKGVVASLLAQGLRFVRLTNPLVKGSGDIDKARAEFSPAIVAMWHGQHFMAPSVYPKGAPLVAMVSRSADAELNALVIEKFGIRTVRGSGGRENARLVDKGGARALIALKKALDDGSNVFMIADIPHGTPRQAGLGIITLARLSGRPIVPVAIVTSRRKVLERSWDKTTIHLPFGRLAVQIGEPVRVAADAGAAEMEAARAALSARLDAANARAYEMVGGQR